MLIPIGFFLGYTFMAAMSAIFGEATSSQRKLDTYFVS